MIETEILVEVYDSLNNTKEKLKRFCFEGEKRTIDTYYYDPLRSGLKPHTDGKLYAAFRVRQKGKASFVTYKNDHYTDGLWQYSDEYEVQIDEISAMRCIVENLGLKELLVIDSQKYIYCYDDYEIVLEEVQDLGLFLEVELKRAIEATTVPQEKEKIMDFILSTGINVSEELNSGKPELYIKKNKLFG